MTRRVSKEIFSGVMNYDEEDGLELPFISQHHDDDDSTGEEMEQQPYGGSASYFIIEGTRKLWNAYTESLLQQPLLTNMVSSGLTGLAGDAMAQKLQGRESLDLWRFLVYGFMSILYVAPFVHFWFAFLERIIPSENEKWETDSDSMDSSRDSRNLTHISFRALKMICVDQLFAAPICMNECKCPHCVVNV